MSLPRLSHFLGIASVTTEQLQDLIRLTRKLQTLAPTELRQLLPYKTIVTLFYENSTRTRCSFELAAKRLGAHLVNLNLNTSSVAKGESMLDTLLSLAEMDCDGFVIRHPTSQVLQEMASRLPQQSLINAGDGSHEHPTQALLDCVTLTEVIADLTQLRIAIVGDVVHSRVANSLQLALSKLGVRDIRLVAPDALQPEYPVVAGVQQLTELNQGLADVDIVYSLRLQRERFSESEAESCNSADYIRHYQITLASLAPASPRVRIMHPGPVNRDVELSSEVADSPYSLILNQVHNGVWARMAVLYRLLATEFVL